MLNKARGRPAKEKPHRLMRRRSAEGRPPDARRGVEKAEAAWNAGRAKERACAEEEGAKFSAK